MTGLVRKATLFGVCALLAASTALANVPDPTNSTCPDWIFVVGELGGTTPDAVGTFTVTVRDFAANPISGAQVFIKFENACDINLCTAVVNGQTVDCDSSIVKGITDAAGEATFTILGGAKAPLYNAPGFARVGGLGSIIIEASGVKLCGVTGVVLDQNGAAGGNGLNGADLGALATDVGAIGLGQEPYIGRGDQNCDGNVNGADIGSLASDVGRVGLAGGSLCSTATFCKQASCP